MPDHFQNLCSTTSPKNTKGRISIAEENVVVLTLCWSIHLGVNISFDYYLSLGLDTGGKSEEESMAPGQNMARHKAK